MKCNNCPLKNCSRYCEGEHKKDLCEKDKYIKLFTKFANGSECNGDSSIPREYPAITEQAKNFFSSMFNHLISGLPKVSQEISDERMSICLTCDQYDPNHKGCFVCGCYLPEKVAMADQECPLKKWLSVDLHYIPSSGNLKSKSCSC